ncbi:(S)-benzoin forming benzil reductase [Bacillus suaedaesalsae]|uniref:(S)-benzoin forming benzil reductase n=1 Tax=Bacillus suaedaesalsae TaxID=2810349 RepID=A0ABS2DK12_9BACI|nr:(S)-benzoin forming benzil reductase [Bacillus suaedaesalsae]MBM6618809.1 (S)-benzoin forming benzil reductase [Bacillus suaedaesalsae]
MNYYIVTGASKGLGQSIVNLLFKKGNTVFAVSRSINHELVKKAKDLEVTLHWHTVNVGHIDETESVFNTIFERVNIDEIDSITLINNAGVIEPINTVGSMESNEIKMNVETNLLAPMVWTNLFLENTQALNTSKRVVNVSSGAANNPYSGWSVYCSTKAGLDMFTKTVGLEQGKEQYPATVISFSPGIMDTTMQTTIRSKSKEQFETIDIFKSYKEEGMLRTTDYVGSVLLNLLDSSEIENGKVYDIKQLI